MSIIWVFLEKYVYFLNNIIKIIVPLSFTIYFFGHREQKDIAYSLLKRKSTVNVVGFLISSALMVILIIYLIPNSTDIAEKPETLSKFGIIITTIISLAWIYFSFTTYYMILRSINVLGEFGRNISLVNDKLDEYNNLQFNKNGIKDNYLFAKKVQKEFRQIIISVEICFQILISKDKFKLNNDYTESLDSINKTLIRGITEINKDEEKFSNLVPYSGETYLKLYIITLTYMNTMLEVSLKNNRHKEVNLILDYATLVKPFGFYINHDLRRDWLIYKELSGKSSFSNIENLYKEFFNEYFSFIFQLITSLSQQNDTRIVKILDNLIIQEYDNSKFFSENDFLSLTTALLLDSIESNNLKTVTDVTNTLLKYLQKEIPIEEHIKINNMKIKINKFNKKQGKNSKELEWKVLNNIFLSMVKAIELGHYSIIGFLVKILVKNFDQKTVCTLIKDLFDNIENTKPDLKISKRMPLYIPLNLSFSPSSYEYCFLKSVVLIYLQQCFAAKIKQIMDLNDEEILELNHFFNSKNENRQYFEYIISKIRGLNKTYGLLALEESYLDEVLDNRYKNI
ncbi:hypothetical protein V1503_18925 [Bacillus sp. SCS-151]|uniref:hypothetical protein n=1 Tax=Nanhaiella sioensis TaxID=3115293 RepID=UPI003979844E